MEKQVSFDLDGVRYYAKVKNNIIVSCFARKGREIRSCSTPAFFKARTMYYEANNLQGNPRTLEWRY